MKISLSLFIMMLFHTFLSNAQESYTLKELQAKTDSILHEANRLFNYEKSSWITTDLAMEEPSIRPDYHSFLTYEVNNGMKTIVLSKDAECIYEALFFLKNDSYKENMIKRDLSRYEENLLKIRENIINQLIDEEYDVGAPDGFSLNMILLPFENGFKFYILTGTSERNIIPFGNDYLFYTDKEGTIQSWKKFHTKLVPLFTHVKGEAVVTLSHSHVKEEPFISATDICTFKLYGGLYDLPEFSVYSPALSKYFTYNLLTDTITISDEL